jgi:hypothetical protein
MSWEDRMTAQTPNAMGQISPDGQYQWNGKDWVRNPNLPRPKKKHTVRNVLLIITALLILVVGGCVALIGGAANEVSKNIKKDANKPGGTNNPLTIVPGRAFAVDNFNYAAGWRVSKDALGDLDITGLKVTNNRSSKDSALVEIKFWRATEVIGLADCTTEPIGVGTTVTLSCSSTDKLPASYSKITINDSF